MKINVAMVWRELFVVRCGPSTFFSVAVGIDFLFTWHILAPFDLLENNNATLK